MHKSIVLKNAVLIEGNCLVKLKSIPNASIDLVLADPPYGVTACKWDSPIDLEALWTQLKRIVKLKGAIIMTAVQPFTSSLVVSNLEMFRYCWCWEKSTASGHLNAKKMPLRAHEDVLIFYKRLPTYNPQKTSGHERKTTLRVNRGKNLSDCYGLQTGTTSYDSTFRYPRSVIKTSTDTQKSSLHPTQKPVALMEYFIRTYSNEEDIILDFAMGSATTGVACLNLNRRFIGIENDPKYFKKALDRITHA